jgi:hypothetical protein
MNNEPYLQQLVTDANASRAASGMDWRLSIVGIGDDFLTIRGIATDEPEDEAVECATYANVRYCGKLNATIKGRDVEVPFVSVEFLKDTGSNWPANPGQEAQIVSKRIHVEAEGNAFWAIMYSAYNEGLL